MNKTILIGLVVAAAMFLAPTASAYPWGPVGEPPANECGFSPVMVNCFYYEWQCSPSYNEMPDICAWRITGFCSVYVMGCIVD
jgi:hypothetical protein